MLTRRSFGQVASCAICSLTGFIASEAKAEDQPIAVTPGITRKVLSRLDGPVSGYVTLLVEVEIKAGTTTGRHTHPGIESSYVLAGSFDFPVEGQPLRRLTTGDAFQVPPHTPHAGGPPSSQDTRLLATYIVEMDKPFATPA